MGRGLDGAVTLGGGTESKPKIVNRYAQVTEIPDSKTLTVVLRSDNSPDAVDFEAGRMIMVWQAAGYDYTPPDKALADKPADDLYQQKIPLDGKSKRVYEYAVIQEAQAG
ncbi:hypothetical protein [Pajaroellobacter abortibovis]|uniref:Uncharacterized protein n=1 Tax=Pajaroellobacter abortibovis TaxID=1882918 RepID=A0A1L6MXF4_9BACT|nr:hypothetical protein [Pajaroellobacter abortibovis]APS00253.1 hypothetical protein BCY86_05810 [Pajaroellobacter abortibovis]